MDQLLVCIRKAADLHGLGLSRQVLLSWVEGKTSRTLSFACSLLSKTSGGVAKKTGPTIFPCCLRGLRKC